jgi:hypothetical protein
LRQLTRIQKLKPDPSQFAKIREIRVKTAGGGRFRVFGVASACASFRLHWISARQAGVCPGFSVRKMAAFYRLQSLKYNIIFAHEDV